MSSTPVSSNDAVTEAELPSPELLASWDAEKGIELNDFDVSKWADEIQTTDEVVAAKPRAPATAATRAKPLAKVQLSRTPVAAAPAAAAKAKPTAKPMTMAELDAPSALDPVSVSDVLIDIPCELDETTAGPAALERGRRRGLLRVVSFAAFAGLVVLAAPRVPALLQRKAAPSPSAAVATAPVAAMVTASVRPAAAPRVRAPSAPAASSGKARRNAETCVQLRRALSASPSGPRAADFRRQLQRFCK